MKSYKTENLRNVGLFGHGGGGKSSLAEAMIFATAALSRLGKVEDGTTTSDYDPEETKRHISVNLSLIPCEWKDRKLNVIDTPGYADFVGEVREAVRVVEGAVILVDAVSGVEVGTEMVWTHCDEFKLPRLIFVNRIDRENADFGRALESARSHFGTKAVAFQLPIGVQDKFQGIVDLVRMKAFMGAKGEEAPIPADMKAAAEAAREKLVEAAAETDDALLNKYLEGEQLTEKEIIGGLKSGVLTDKIVPVLVGSATANKAIPALLDAIVDYLPSPLSGAPVTGVNPANNKPEKRDISDLASLSALVFKTTADPFVGKLTYFRVFSGVMHSDTRVFNANKGVEERLGQIFVMRGKNQEPVVQLGAGDIGAVAKLTETATCDTLCAKDAPIVLPGIKFPAPSFFAAVYPKTKADLDKMGQAMQRLAEEDPTLRVRREADTTETIIEGMGESHVDVAIERMKRKFGAEVVLQVPKIPYKETINKQVNAHHRHKKQTGGHGQFGEVYIRLEPLPRGSNKNEFTEEVVGGSVPKNFIPAVEKGVLEATVEGVLAGYPLTDVRAILYDGKFHDVDSSEMSFKIAGREAIKSGVLDANPVLLEPVVTMEVTVPEQYMGDVIGDLNSKRARVLGMEQTRGLAIVSAMAPLAEVQRYSTDLRSITQGRGTFTTAFDHYEEVPGHIASGIIEKTKKDKEQQEKDKEKE
jgi:elongation factor G